uniref:Myeloid derived growth factor n=1 Tax=Equus asinus TaxID=9793 RepID=A0A9L0K5T3_EQUAS
GAWVTDLRPRLLSHAPSARHPCPPAPGECPATGEQGGRRHGERGAGAEGCAPRGCAAGRELQRWLGRKWTGVALSFRCTRSHILSPQDRYSCVFTYASQGGTNERWQMSLGTSEDHQHFTCTIWRPQGKSYLYFTQFRAEVRGAEVEYGMAYSKAAFEKESDVPLQSEEFEVTKTAVSHRPGAFKSELSKLVIVAKASRSEL